MTSYAAAKDWGDWGENVVRDWFRTAGWFVVPTAAIETGGAPKLVGLLEQHVLPDMQTARDGQMRWVEVKTKTSPVLYQIAREWRHGVDLKNWQAYLEVERITGFPGDLAIVQLRPGPKAPANPTLLTASFASLRDVGEVGTGEYGKKVIFWNVDRFERVVINECQIPDFRSLREVVHPWEQKGKTGTVPQMNSYKQEMFPW